MKAMIVSILALLAACFERRCEKIGAAIEARDLLDVIFQIALLLAYIAGLTAATLGLVALISKFGKYLLIPGGIIVLICAVGKKKPKETPPPPPREPVEVVRARAERTYPIMKQTAFLLFTDLCRFFSGLVAPFSLPAVTGPVNFDITASLIIKYYFVIEKGQCTANVRDIKDVLDTIVFKHLKAQDLPISISAIYTAADGSTWPGLVVDGVYDIGKQFRVDFVITDEAEVTALKAKGLSWSDDDTDTDAPQDPDFD